MLRFLSTNRRFSSLLICSRTGDPCIKKRGEFCYGPVLLPVVYLSTSSKSMVGKLLEDGPYFSIILEEDGKHWRMVLHMAPGGARMVLLRNYYVVKAVYLLTVPVLRCRRWKEWSSRPNCTSPWCNMWKCCSHEDTPCGGERAILYSHHPTSPRSEREQPKGDCRALVKPGADTNLEAGWPWSKYTYLYCRVPRIR